MFYQTEDKLQGWRALAVYADGGECLLCVGRSTSQVRAAYTAPFAELLDEDERGRVGRIVLQCWQGAADRGHWLTKSDLPIPSPKTVAASGAGIGLDARLLAALRTAAA